jgi:hypothetical protein
MHQSAITPTTDDDNPRTAAVYRLPPRATSQVAPRKTRAMSEKFVHRYFPRDCTRHGVNVILDPVGPYGF